MREGERQEGREGRRRWHTLVPSSATYSKPKRSGRLNSHLKEGGREGGREGETYLGAIIGDVLQTKALGQVKVALNGGALPEPA